LTKMHEGPSSSSSSSSLFWRQIINDHHRHNHDDMDTDTDDGDDAGGIVDYIHLQNNDKKQAAAVFSSLFGSSSGSGSEKEKEKKDGHSSSSSTVVDLLVDDLFDDENENSNTSSIHTKSVVEVMYDTNPFINLRKHGSRELLSKTKYPTFQSFQEEYIFATTTTTPTTKDDDADDDVLDGDVDEGDATDGGGSAVISVDKAAFVDDDSIIDSKSRRIIDSLLGLKDFTQQKVHSNDTCMNIYHSGPSAKALQRHYDAYDVIVIQLQGEKVWEVQIQQGQQHEGSYNKQHEEQEQEERNEDGEEKNNKGSSSHDDDDDGGGSKWKNLTLRKGDVLYIPKGVWHSATTSVDSPTLTSTHITIGLISYHEMINGTT